MSTQLPPDLPVSGAQKQTPGFAVASLIFGILAVVGGAILIFPVILAIVFGHVAQSKIRKDPRLGGSGMALAGLILGYVSIAMFFVVGLLAAMAIPAFQKVRQESLRKAMINDARQISAAAQQTMLEEGARSVSFHVNPATGEVQGPLSRYVKQITKGTEEVDGTIEGDSDGFSLRNPHVDHGKEIRFDATGKPE